MSNTETVQAIEKTIQQAKELVEFGKALDRLRTNRDFKTVMISGYLEQESIRLVLLKADPNMQTVEKQVGVVKQIDAIGSLSQYFNAVRVQSLLAEKDIAANEQERELMILEGL